MREFSLVSKTDQLVWAEEGKKVETGLKLQKAGKKYPSLLGRANAVCGGGSMRVS